MAKKTKGFFSRFLESQFFDLIFQYLTIPFVSIVSGGLASIWARRFEALSVVYLWVDKMTAHGTFQAIIAYIVIGLGFSTGIYLLISFVIRLVSIFGLGDRKSDSSARLLKEFSEKKAAARQLANFVEDFNARFKHIREAYPYPDERDKLAKGGDVHLMRLQDANESFNRMYELFNSIKYDLVNRKGIEDNTQKLWVLLQKYSNDVNLWKQNPSQKILENAVLHKGADKVMKEADTIAETIKELLTPNMYPNVTRISYERFNSHDKINPKDDQDNKKDNP